MFKPRKAPSAVPATPPAIEVVRQRAKHRLIGASLLVLVGVVVFPVLFDTQPRPIPVDVPIEIPSRQSAKPLGKAAVPVEEFVGAERSLSQREQIVESASRLEIPGAPAKPLSAVSVPDRVTPAESKPVLKPPVTVPVLATGPSQAVPASNPAAKESQRAQALLDGRSPARPNAVATASGERFIVQVGAFADASTAQQVRIKLERAGLKTYTHVADMPEGRRTRVRLGPFTSKADADKAAAKAKGLGLAASILTL